jgi:hypothetical protein
MDRYITPQALDKELLPDNPNGYIMAITSLSAEVWLKFMMKTGRLSIVIRNMAAKKSVKFQVLG